MKIDWGEAPNWAQWLAVDGDGEAYWFEEHPYVSNSLKPVWHKVAGTMASFAWTVKGFYGSTFKEALYQRPAKKDLEIDWTKAPAWTQWLAVDDDGEAYWFENKPKVVRKLWDLETGDVEFAFSTQVPENFTKELYERPKKADLKIDWTKAPDWAQWLAVDAIGSAYWYRERPLPDLEKRQWHYPAIAHRNFDMAFDAEGPEDFTQALYERPTTDEETIVNYNIELISAIRIKYDSETVEISEDQWRSARNLMSLVDPELDEYQWPKIKCIKLYRQMQPGLGLRDAKVVVEAAWQERYSYHF